ncbi:MAG: PcfB family protein [Oscillospiraceae bacterium]|nr:PcfB family protein [Oscillospiraceae bacterium]MBR3016855.1 PcfB family protein [Clostridia bacterium]MBR3431912.1 PcfB family protein [Clostridia bacterium]NLD30554.1 PcfB family protein [Clostridiales bacterium]
MQEEVENRTVNLAISTSRLSARTIVAGIRMYLQHQRNAAAKKPTKVEGVHGKQTVKELIGQNQGVSRMPLGDASIRDFEREARKYGVDFAVTKDKSVHPPQYTVFFKARDNDALQQIADSLMAKQLNAEKKPSIVKQLEKLKALVASLPSKVRHKEQEHSL